MLIYITRPKPNNKHMKSMSNMRRPKSQAVHSLICLKDSFYYFVATLILCACNLFNSQRCDDDLNGLITQFLIFKEHRILSMNRRTIQNVNK